MEGSVGPADGVFGEGATGSHHFVEGGDTVTGLKFVDIGADGVHDAGDVIAGVVVVVWDDFGDFPGGVVRWEFV
jgi:hypothetical protein